MFQLMQLYKDLCYLAVNFKTMTITIQYNCCTTNNTGNVISIYWDLFVPIIDNNDR